MPNDVVELRPLGAPPSPRPVLGFVSYDREDQLFRDELVKHLTPITRSGRMCLWDRASVALSEKPDEVAPRKIVESGLFFALLSADYTAGSAIDDLSIAMRDPDRAVVLIQVRPCLLPEQVSRLPFVLGDKVLDADRRAREGEWVTIAKWVSGRLGGGDSTVSEPVSPAPSPPMGRALPLPPVHVPCVGRDGVIADLVERVAKSPARVAVTGSLGIGKSAVVGAVYHHAETRRRFAERRYFATFPRRTPAEKRAAGAEDKIRESVVREVWLAIACALGFQLQGEGRGLGRGGESGAEALVLRDLQSGPALLVLDELDVVVQRHAGAVEEVLSKLARVDALALVVAVRGKKVPAGLDGTSRPVDLGPLSAEHAEELFATIAGEVPGSKEDRSWLVSRQEGLPLAITLLARRAQGNQLANIRARLEADGAEPLGATWRDAIALSMDTEAPSPSQALLRVLSRLPAGLSAASVGALFPGGEPEEDAARAGLAQWDSRGRLGMLAPIREQVARRFPPDPGDLQRAVDLHVGLAKELGEKVGAPGGAAAADRLRDELPNIDVSLREALKEQDPTRAIEATLALTRFGRMTGTPLSALFGAAREAARRTGGVGEIWDTRCVDSLAQLAQADRKAAEGLFGEALAGYRRAGRLADAAQCLRRLGDLASAHSDRAQAEARYREALALAEEAKDAPKQGDCLRAMGDLTHVFAREEGEIQAAEAWYVKALAIYPAEGHARERANGTLGLADVRFLQGRLGEAKSLYEEAQAALRGVGDFWGDTNTRLRLAHLAIEARGARDGEAIGRELGEVRERFRRVNDALGEAACLFLLGKVDELSARAVEARGRYEEALSVYQRFGDPVSEALVHQALSKLAGMPDKEARQHARAAAELRREASIGSGYLDPERAVAKGAVEQRPAAKKEKPKKKKESSGAALMHLNPTSYVAVSGSSGKLHIKLPRVNPSAKSPSARKNPFSIKSNPASLPRVNPTAKYAK